MWSLTDSLGKVIQMKQDTIITVGRRNADLLLENDNSISKSHAKILILKSDDSKLKHELTCVIMDAGSKYGSFVLGKNNALTRISRQGYHVQPMDTIRFGLQQHVFTVSYTPLNKYLVLVSSIYGEERDELSKVLEIINGVLCHEWNPLCTHVTCPTVRLTEKVGCALVAGLHIVTKEYWYAMVKSQQMQNKTISLPNPEDYTPKIDSSILVTDKVSLLPNPQRKILFKNKTFIFFDGEQCGVFSRMIELAGGTSTMYSETWKPQDCCADNIIVVQAMKSSQTSQLPSFEYRSVCLRLSQEKLRRIPESEIPLAILYCSTQQYCNPRYNYDHLLQPNAENSVPSTSSNVLVPETQEFTFKQPKCNKMKRIIPESVSTNTQSQMTPDIHKQTSTTLSQPIVNKRNVIIPESEPMESQSTSRMQSQMSNNVEKRTPSTVSQSKSAKNNVIIPESVPIASQLSAQMQSQMSVDTREETCTTSERQQSSNNRNNKAVKSHVKDVEVLNQSISLRLAQNEHRSNKDSWEMPEPNDSNDEFNDADSESTFESPKRTQPTQAHKSSRENTIKKRAIDVISSGLPNNHDNNDKKSLAKRRKLNRNDESNVIQPTDEEIYESVSRININEKNGKNSTSSRNIVNTSHVESHDESSLVPHYFSRNNLNKPKCIIPPKRITPDDMFEWKPNKQL